MNHINTERRCANRTAISLPVTLKIDHNAVASKMLDISLCGMSIITSDKIVEHHSLNPIDISVTLPSYEQSNQLNLSATIVRSTNFQNQFFIGLAFTNLNLHQQLVIKEFCAFHQRLSS